MNLRTAACVAAAVVVLAGCATPSAHKLYDGPERPAAEVASVMVPWQVQVRSVNGQKTPLSLYTGSAGESNLRVLPGAQDWQVLYSDPFADEREDHRNPYRVDKSGVETLRFQADAGHVYRIRFETPDSNPSLRNARQQVSFSVVETASGEEQPAMVIRGVSSPAPGPAEAVPFEQATLDQLKNWWRAAGPAERKAFKEWIDEEN